MNFLCWYCSVLGFFGPVWPLVAEQCERLCFGLAGALICLGA